jgi:hypothetical protein
LPLPHLLGEAASVKLSSTVSKMMILIFMLVVLIVNRQTANVKLLTC